MLPYGHQIIEDCDIEAVTAALRSDWLTTGPLVARFESAFAAAVGAAHAVAVSSGTAALHAAAFAADIGAHHEAVVPAMTFAASANCIRYQGGWVAFADVAADTLTMDRLAVERVLTPRTRAVIAVDYAGQPADLDDLIALVRAHGAILIEDAAHALGAWYSGRRVGSIADLTVFSLHPVKQMTTGEGGVVTTDDAAFAARLRRFRNHGIDADAAARHVLGSWEYQMLELGYNYRLTDVQCALGLAQLDRLPEWLHRREAIAAKYAAGLRAVPEVEPLSVRQDRRSAWHLYVVKLDLERLTVDRATVYRALRAENIGVNVHYVPVPWHPYYASLGYKRGSWPVSERAYEQMLTLPLWAGMSEADVDDVLTAVEKVCTAYRR